MHGDNVGEPSLLSVAMSHCTSCIANAISEAKVKGHQDGDHSTPKSTLHQETEKVSSQVQKWMLRMQAAKSQGA